jgi:hypothetical protein
MKIIKNTFLALIICFALASCDDFFSTPTNIRDLNYTFSNGHEVISWLADSYSYIPNPFLCILTTDVDYGMGWWKYSHPYILMADESDLNDTRYCYKSWRINLGDWNASEGGFGEKWDVFYKQIRHLYVFLDNVKVVPGQREIDSQDKVDNLKLEARFLIAYFYVLLFEQFGPIPLIESAYSVDSDLQDLKVQRNSIDEVVNWLDDELLSIANQLPIAPVSDTYAARPTQAAALAIRARLLLYAASPLFKQRRKKIISSIL